MYTKFELFERLGMNESLYELVDKVIDSFDEPNKIYSRIAFNHRGKEIMIDCYLKPLLRDDKNVKAFIRYDGVDQYHYMFSLYLTKFDRSDILHELKHMDRRIARNSKDDPYTYINCVGSFICKHYKHLLTDGKAAGMLEDALYLINPEEFEAHYSGCKEELDLLINDKQSREEKIEIIKNFLNDKGFFLYYSIFYNRAFDLSIFFKNNNDLNEFLTLYSTYSDRLRTGGNTSINNLDVLKSKINKFFKFFKKDDKEINKKLKEINFYMNKQIKVGYKKIFRLYSLYV